MSNFEENKDMKIKGHRLSSFEELIKKIPSINAVKLVVNDKNKIIECHILANNDRNVKQIVRDIQSSIMAKYDIEIDHKIISVAQIDDQVSLPKESVKKEIRLRLKKINISLSDENLEAKICIVKDNVEYWSDVVSCTNKHMKVSTIAIAAVDVVNTIVGKRTFELMHAQTLGIDHREICLASIRCVDSYDEDGMLLGAVYLKSDIYRSVVYAVLNAVNRRIERNFNK